MPPSSKYEILAPIGRGPRAMVYRGRQTALGTEIAIKEVNPALPPRAMQRVLAAVERWVRLPHDHLLAVRDVDLARDWIITDLMQGNSAAAAAAQGLRPADVEQVLAQCLAALDFVHVQCGCLHANIKPSNILFDQ